MTIHAVTNASGRVPWSAIGGHLLPMLDRACIYACGITPYDVTVAQKYGRPALSRSSASEGGSTYSSGYSN